MSGCGCTSPDACQCVLTSPDPSLSSSGSGTSADPWIIGLTLSATGGLISNDPAGLGVLLDPSLSNLLTLSAAGLFASGGGVWTDWTPVLSQPAALNLSSSRGRYKTVGKIAFLRWRAVKSSSGTGTAGSPVVVSGWPAAINPDGVSATAPGANTPLGIGHVYDLSATDWYTAEWVWVSATTMTPFTGGVAAPSAPWGQDPSIALATSDELGGVHTWETV